MNVETTTCDVCGETAHPQEWLRCMLCGRTYHFGSEAAVPRERDCGIVAPNPQSENGC